MKWPEGIEERPIELGDAVALAQLRADTEKVDDEGEHEDADDVLEWLRHPWFDRDASLALWTGDRAVAWAVIWSGPEQRDTDRINVVGGVHPDHRRRGIGRGLLDWAVDQAERRHRARHPDLPGELNVGTVDGNTGMRTMLDRAGFAPVRYFVDMVLQLDPPPATRTPETTEVPDGMSVTSFDERYDEQTRLAHNEAFADHWGSTPREPAAWRARTTGSKTFRPVQSSLLVDGDEVASYVLGYEYDGDTAATGSRDLYIGQVGTRRRYRGRGAATLLMTRTLQAAADDGFATVSLGVDADNPTGAFGLYERLGFVPTRRFTTYAKALAGPGSP